MYRPNQLALFLEFIFSGMMIITLYFSSQAFSQLLESWVTRKQTQYNKNRSVTLCLEFSFSGMMIITLYSRHNQSLNFSNPGSQGTNWIQKETTLLRSASSSLLRYDDYHFLLSSQAFSQLLESWVTRKQTEYNKETESSTGCARQSYLHRQPNELDACQVAPDHSHSSVCFFDNWHKKLKHFDRSHTFSLARSSTIDTRSPGVSSSEGMCHSHILVLVRFVVDWHREDKDFSPQEALLTRTLFKNGEWNTREGN
jgi:uncharacterized protein YheU (UPF0270 family)